MAFNLDNLVHLGMPPALAQELLTGLVGDVQFKTHSGSNATLAAGVATGASQCIVNTTANSANAVTLRTAAQMFADIPSCIAGFTYALDIYNTGNGAVTLTAPDANTTITGPANIASNTRRSYVATFNTATTMTLQNVSSVTGVDVTTVGATQLFPLGSRTIAASGNVFVYGQAATAVAQFDFVTIDVSGNINSLMASDVKAGKQIGSSQVAIAASSFGWVCISGSGLLMNVQASTQISVPVIPGPTTGRVDTTAGVAAGVTSILGVQLILTAGLTATAIAGALTNPVLKL
jgi:hypothetical protein